MRNTADGGGSGSNDSKSDGGRYCVQCWQERARNSIVSGEPTLQLTVTGANEAIVVPFLADLEAANQRVKHLPTEGGAEGIPNQPAIHPAAIEQLAAIDPSTLTPELLDQLLSGLGLAPGQLPGGMADINRLLRVLPPEVTERLFIAITSGMYTPKTSRS